LTTPICYLPTIPIDLFENNELKGERMVDLMDFVVSSYYAYVDDDPEDPGYDHGLMIYMRESADLYGYQPLLIVAK
jgi:hypothetical protein